MQARGHGGAQLLQVRLSPRPVLPWRGSWTSVNRTWRGEGRAQEADVPRARGLCQVHPAIYQNLAALASSLAFVPPFSYYLPASLRLASGLVLGSASLVWFKSDAARLGRLGFPDGSPHDGAGADVAPGKGKGLGAKAAIGTPKGGKALKVTFDPLSVDRKRQGKEADRPPGSAASVATSAALAELSWTDLDPDSSRFLPEKEAGPPTPRHVGLRRRNLQAELERVDSQQEAEGSPAASSGGGHLAPKAGEGSAEEVEALRGKAEFWQESVRALSAELAKKQAALNAHAAELQDLRGRLEAAGGEARAAAAERAAERTAGERRAATAGEEAKALMARLSQCTAALEEHERRQETHGAEVLALQAKLKATEERLSHVSNANVGLGLQIDELQDRSHGHQGEVLETRQRLQAEEAQRALAERQVAAFQQAAEGHKNLLGDLSALHKKLHLAEQDGQLARQALKAAEQQAREAQEQLLACREQEMARELELLDSKTQATAFLREREGQVEERVAALREQLAGSQEETRAAQRDGRAAEVRAGHAEGLARQLEERAAAAAADHAAAVAQLRAEQEDRLAALRSEYAQRAEAAGAEKAEVEAEAAALRARVQELQRADTERDRGRLAAEAELHRSRAAEVAATGEREELRARLADSQRGFLTSARDAETEIAALQRQLGEAAAKFTAVQEEAEVRINGLEGQLAAAEETHARELGEARAQAQQLERRLEGSRADLGALLYEAKLNAQRLEQELADREQQLEQADRQGEADARDRAEALAAARERGQLAQARAAALDSQLRSRQELLEQRDGELDRAQQKHQQLVAQVAELEPRAQHAAALQGQVRHQKAEIALYRSDLDRKTAEALKLQQSMQKLHSGIQQATSTSFARVASAASTPPATPPRPDRGALSPAAIVPRRGSGAGLGLGPSLRGRGEEIRDRMHAVHSNVAGMQDRVRRLLDEARGPVRGPR